MRTDPNPYRRSRRERFQFDLEGWRDSIRAFGRGWAVEYWDGGNHAFRWFFTRRRASAFGERHAWKAR